MLLVFGDGAWPSRKSFRFLDGETRFWGFLGKWAGLGFVVHVSKF